ncbi:MAG: hypothetical protein Q8Q32_01505 [bacterium]|nr:hypothetical protein [bacterium]
MHESNGGRSVRVESRLAVIQEEIRPQALAIQIASFKRGEEVDSDRLKRLVASQVHQLKIWLAPGYSSRPPVPPNDTIDAQVAYLERVEELYATEPPHDHRVLVR